MSDLSKKFKCGLKPRKHHNENNTIYKFSILDYKHPLPESFSLKSKMIRFVQSHNDCGSVSTMHQVMALKNIKEQLSVLYQYWWARKLDGNESSDSGTSIDKNLEAVIFHGFVDAKLYSYEDQHLLTTPDTEVMQAGHKNTHQFKSYRRLLQNLWNIK